jgi:hypothetical protein
LYPGEFAQESESLSLNPILRSDGEKDTGNSIIIGKNSKPVDPGPVVNPYTETAIFQSFLS